MPVPTPVLETRRLWLRPQSQADAPALQRRFPRWEIVRYLPNAPWPYPPDGAVSYLAMAEKEMADGKKHHWSLWLKDGPDEPVGGISLWADDGEQRDQRGFWLDPEFQRRGLMTEAAERVTEYAFRDLGWPHLWVSNLLENQRSAAVKLRQGAHLVATERRTYPRGEFVRQVWRIEAAEWMNDERRRLHPTPQHP